MRSGEDQGRRPSLSLTEMINTSNQTDTVLALGVLAGREQLVPGENTEFRSFQPYFIADFSSANTGCFGACVVHIPCSFS